MNIALLLLMIFSAVSFTACQSAREDAPPKSESEIKQLTVSEAKPLVEKSGVQFIDVRTAAEYESGRAPRAENFPLDELETSLSRLDKARPVYLICETGRRSQIGAELLQKNGFTDIYNIQGGTSGWRTAGFPVEK